MATSTSKKRYFQPAELKSAGSTLPYREVELRLTEDSELGWFKYIPMSSTTLIRIQALEERKKKKEIEDSEFATALLGAIQECLLNPNSTANSLTLMFTPENVGQEIAAECLGNVILVMTGGAEKEKKVLEIPPQSSQSSGSPDNAESGTSED